MKSKKSQKFAKNIRELKYVFEALIDSPDNIIWKAKNTSNSELVLTKYDDALWTCHIEHSEYTDDFKSFKHLDTKDAVEDCLTQIYEWLTSETQYYGNKLGKISI